MLKNWRVLGPWFQRRLRVSLTRVSDQWKLGESRRVLARVLESEVVRTRVAMAAEEGGSGGGRWFWRRWGDEWVVVEKGLKKVEEREWVLAFWGRILDNISSVSFFFFLD